MTKSYISHTFTINSVPYQLDTNIRINIKKRKEQVYYRTLSNQDNINIAYVIGKPVNPSNNLFLSDRSTSLAQNRVKSDNDVTVFTGASVTLTVDDFLITDVYTDETSSIQAIPLFYAHKFTYYNDSLSDFSDRTLLGVEFTDYKLKTIKVEEYKIDSEYGYIYNNLQNSYSETDNSFSVYFVKYTVKLNSDINVYHELLNNDRVYEQAEFEDLDEYGNIISGRRKYLISESPGLQSYLISLPYRATYSYKESYSSKIRVLPPLNINSNDIWSVRVSNGKFISSMYNTRTTALSYKYYIAEFNSQTFYPYPPYKQLLNKSCTWLYDNIIYLPKNIVEDDDLALYAVIIVKDKNEDLKYIFTNNPDLIGQSYNSSIAYTDGILSVDRSGFIELSTKLNSDDIITATFYTEEDEYDFTFVDFNPSNNLDILNQKIVIYLNPENALTGEFDTTIHYLIVDSTGKIQYSSQVDGASTALADSATLKMLTEDFNNTGTPTHTFYYELLPSTENIASGIAGYAGYREKFSFIDKYTVDSSLITTTLYSGTIYDSSFEGNPRYLVLADIYVGENDSPQALTTFDVRIQGGGIKDEYLSAAIEENPEITWYWDQNVRRNYPAAGAFIAEVPQSLLTDFGGDFSRDQIINIVNKHMKAGGYAIVKTYGVNPVITNYTTTSNSAYFEWASYGSDYTYNAYRSYDIEKDFILANSGIIGDIEDNSSGNHFTMSGLLPSTKYYIKLSAVDSDDYESYGTTISATTTTSVA